MLEAALEYAAMGWRVFPVAAGTNDKPLMDAWPTACSGDPATIEEMWDRWPRANVAIVMRASGLVVIDVDPRHGGKESLHELQRKHEPLMSRCASTPRGGFHYYFKYDGGDITKNNSGLLGGGIDVQAGNAYVIAPPSVRPEGKYLWLPSDLDAAPLPEWLRSLLVAPRSSSTGSGDKNYRQAAWNEGGRNAGLTSLAGRLRRDGLSEAAILAALLEENQVRCAPPLPVDEVRRIAKSVGRYEQGDVGGGAGGGSAAWVKTHTTESLDVVPPPKKFILRDARTGRGVMLASKVGILAAKGGTGKSQMAIQFAVAVATGGTLFGQGLGLTAERGRALLVMAEEDEAEIAGRLHYSTRGPLVSKECSGRITTVAMSGRDASLLKKEPGGNLIATAFVAEITKILKDAHDAGDPYALAVFDPLSRHAGPDAEIDNHSATQFIETLEGFTFPELGAPTVLVCHHVRKAGKDDSKGNSASIRGASSLHDSARWAGLMEAGDKPGMIDFSVVKGNGVKPGFKLALEFLSVGEYGILGAVRDHGGSAEPAESDEDVVSGFMKRIDWLEKRILQVLKFRPMGTTEIQEATKAKRINVSNSCSWLERDGKLKMSHRKWSLASTADVG